MRSLSPRMKQILYAAGALAIIALVVVVGVLIGNRLGGGSKLTTKSVMTATPMAASIKPTATLSSGAGAQGAQATSAAPGERVAVPEGRVENETGIAILPTVALRGDRRYVLQVASKAGALPFTGSYSRGSIDPKIAIDVKTDIKGTMPWEEEIQPPAPDARQWNLGVSLSLNPLGKNVQVQIWDVGPR